MHIRAKAKPRDQMTGLCRGTDLGEGYKKDFWCLKVPNSTVGSIILKWKRFRITRTLLRAGPTHHSNGEEWWWQHHAVGVFFSGRDWGSGQG